MIQNLNLILKKKNRFKNNIYFKILCPDSSVGRAFDC